MNDFVLVVRIGEFDTVGLVGVSRNDFADGNDCPKYNVDLL